MTASRSIARWTLMLATAGIIGTLVSVYRHDDGATGGASKATSGTAAVVQVAASPWTASAPGRVEPRRGEIRLSAQAPGRIAEIAAALNERVEAGDLLLRLDDEEAKARVAAAESEASVRRRERDEERNVPRLVADRRSAEDVVAQTERTVAIARGELDRVQRQRRDGVASATKEAVTTERNALKAAQDKLEVDRAALRRAQNVNGIALPTRLEAGLTAARSDLALAELALERTRVRAPSDGVVLQIMPRVGEMASAAPDQTLITIGDLERLRVRAELEERDIAKVTLGQPVIVKTDAFAGKEFTGTVASLAKTLALARLAQRGPRRPNDVDTLEIMVDLDANTDLLPGMRVDVFFKAPATATLTPAAPAAAVPAAIPGPTPAAATPDAARKQPPPPSK